VVFFVIFVNLVFLRESAVGRSPELAKRFEFHPVVVSSSRRRAEGQPRRGVKTNSADNPLRREAATGHDLFCPAGH
jgi:hypothetical protein